MKKSVWTICTVIAAVAMAAALALCLTRGACDGMLDCGTTQVHMKCYWAYLAAATICGIGVIAALLGAAQKQAAARRVCAILTVVAAVCAILVLYVIIGVCAKDTMVCIGNRIPVLICAIASIIAALAGIAKADDAKAALPKASL